MFQVKRNGKVTLLGFALAVLIATAVAAVPGIFSSVNSTNGYKVSGAAGSSGQVLCSNGTYYNTACDLFYQTVESDGTGQTQRSALNFSSDFTVSDSSSPSRTTIALANPSTAHQILAVWSGSSCTLVDNGGGGSYCDATTVSWGSTISGTYYWSCSVGILPLSPSDGKRGSLTFNSVSQSSTDFTYFLNSPYADGRTLQVPMSCFAFN